MKKALLISFILSTVFCLSAKAEESVLGNYIADIEEAATARVSARDLLQSQPARLKINMPKIETSPNKPQQMENLKIEEPKEEAVPISTSEENAEPEEIVAAPSIDEVRTEAEIKKEELEQTQEDTDNRYIPAPFDLYWGADKDYIQKQGWQLTPASRDGYENVFTAENENYPHNNFETVSAIFGNNNKLWCIYAESMPIDDTPQAAKVLELYAKYYEALEQKYGNAEVHFEPYTYEVQTTQMQNGAPVILTQTVQNPAGGDTFLQELQEGKARLYSTFYNNDIGATLAIYVDENAKSRLIIEYKNLPLMDKERQQMPIQVQSMEGL